MQNHSKNKPFVSTLNDHFTSPDQGPRQCEWGPDKPSSASPHRRVDWRQYANVWPDVLAGVGNTPLVRLNRIPQSLGLQCDVYAKCEFFNPGGSTKDRIGLRMIEDAEHDGILKPGSTIIEPTSGNTGIGLALAAAVKGYKCIIVMSEKMSDEKVNVLKALGARIIRTPITASSMAPDGLFAVCHRLVKEIPNSIILDQYSNPGNPLAHYDGTVEEMMDQCQGKIDMLCIGTGTGGTITGIGKKIKEVSPETIVVGIDPYGSQLAVPPEVNKCDKDFYEVEGIGYDFLPVVFDRSVVDKWIKTDDEESFKMARRLIKEEGFLCGGSSGTCVLGAMKAAKHLKKGQKVVVLLPDSIRNYLTKFVSDNWLEIKGFKECENPSNHKWWGNTVGHLNLGPLTSLKASTTCNEALDIMKTEGFDQLPLIDSNGGVSRVVLIQKLMTAFINGTVQGTSPVDKAATTIFPKVTKRTSLGLLSRILELDGFAVVVEEGGASAKIDKPIAIVSTIDLLKYVTSN